MPRYDTEFAHHLETLRQGGLEAIFLFLDVAREFDEKGHELLSNWIGVAIAALPETDRAAALTHLLRKEAKPQLRLVQPTRSSDEKVTR